MDAAVHRDLKARANLDFGAGALSCNDLYSGGNGIKIVKLPVTGANVPWHRE